jgi:hypothetical protein
MATVGSMALSYSHTCTVCTWCCRSSCQWLTSSVERGTLLLPPGVLAGR